MRCSQCDKINDDRAKYCSECGSRLSPVDTVTSTAAGGSIGSVSPVDAPPVVASVVASADATTLAAGPAPSPGHTPEAPSPEAARYASRLLESAAAARAAGQTAAAETICKEALRLDPDNLPGHSLLGDLLEQRGNIAGALAERVEVKRLSALQSPPAAGHPWKNAVRAGLHGRSPADIALIGALLLLLFSVGAVALSVLHPASTTSNILSQDTARVSLAPAAGTVRSPVARAPLLPSAAGSSSFDPDSLEAGTTAPSLTSSAGATAHNVPGNSETINLPQFNAGGASPEAPPARSARRSRTAGRRLQSSENIPMAVPESVVLPPARTARPVRSSTSRATSAGTGAPIMVTMDEAEAPGRPSSPASFGTSLSKAREDYQAQRYAEAIPEYRSAVRSAPTVLDAATARQELAMAYSAMHSPREASDEYHAAESDYSSLLTGPDAARAKEAIQNIHAQLQLPENRQ